MVRAYGVSPDPVIDVTPAGLVMVHLGFGGDDPSEVDQILDEVATRLVASMPAVKVVPRFAQLSDLFAPSLVEFELHRSSIVWTVGADTLAHYFENESMPRFLDRLRRMAAGSCSLVIANPRSEDRALIDGCQTRKIHVVATEVGRAFLAEVNRPDGINIVGWLRDGHVISPGPFGSPEQLLRAPRLRRLLLGVQAHDTAEAWLALLEELHTRRHQLLFFVQPGGTMGLVHWPGQGVALPVFGDLRSVFRTAAETNRPPNSYAVGSLPGPKLFAHALEQGFGVALCVFLDDGQVRYVPLSNEMLTVVAGR
jgi:hypothetical protein